MSSDGSRTTSSSRLSQFGIYRSIDAKTEEFLHLSKKRQIRQGCACAIVSTAVTVTIMIVILLIYEYAIAVETSLVQKIRNGKNLNQTKDSPVADKLGRSYFGLDQEYYERMPLMVNAMEEDSYVVPSTDTSFSIKPKARYIISNYTKPTTFRYRTNSIRRTSPRPFHYEYKSPTPMPFSKTYGSRSWIDSYRNNQRMKNLQQVINYLEKTINAKFGDLYSFPTSTIAFSGIYVEPVVNDGKQTKPTVSTLDLISDSSRISEKINSNHKLSDPLFSYKPESPGDVNLLADGFFRFSPVPTISVFGDKRNVKLPMFKPITSRKTNCFGIKCNTKPESKIFNSEEETKSKETGAISDKLKTFSVMLNLYPLTTNSFDNKSTKSMEITEVPINKIYITTSRPTVQFRRKSTTPIRRTTIRLKRPALLPMRKLLKPIDYISAENKEPTVIEPKMIVHVNVYPSTELKDQFSTEINGETTTTTVSPTKHYTQSPMLISTQVEDYHVGSSGIIPPEARLTVAPLPTIPTQTPTLPSITDILLPKIDASVSNSEPNIGTTNPPEILKFSHEDAKIPDHYKDIIKSEYTTSNQPAITRRNFKDNSESYENYDIQPTTLVTKLKNENIESTTAETDRNTFTTVNKKIENASTVKTYVPQINGHYRSVNQNSKNINTWINENTQSNRKKRLEMSITGFRKSTYVPQYIEIKRNNTRNSSDTEQTDKEDE